ncbi:peptidase inhibitor family I36 protein [Nocardia sp. NPDC057668]|uniref:peptidase inhibitor family I36 protein n=1 Tax=Nocardia sp. NPDC057668 TaxID=3346202 RepID=UPI00366B7B21
MGTFGGRLPDTFRAGGAEKPEAIMVSQLLERHAMRTLAWMLLRQLAIVVAVSSASLAPAFAEPQENPEEVPSLGVDRGPSVGKSSTCPSGYCCLFEDANYGGTSFLFPTSSPAGKCQKFSTGFGNRATSWWNNTSRELWVYVGANCESSGLFVKQLVRPGEKVATLDTPTFRFLDNQIESLSFK